MRQATVVLAVVIATAGCSAAHDAPVAFELELPVPDIASAARPEVVWQSDAGVPRRLHGGLLFTLDRGDPRDPGNVPVLEAIDVQTGATRWKAALPASFWWANPDLLESGTAAVVVSGEASHGENAFIAFDPRDGKRLWETRVGTLLYGSTAISSRALLLCMGRFVSAFDLASGERRETGTACNRIAASGDLIAVTAPDRPHELEWMHVPGRVSRLDPRTFEPMWTSDFEANLLQVTPNGVFAALGCETFDCDDQGAAPVLASLEPEDGLVSWRTPLPLPIERMDGGDSGRPLAAVPKSWQNAPIRLFDAETGEPVSTLSAPSAWASAYEPSLDIGKAWTVVGMPDSILVLGADGNVEQSIAILGGVFSLRITGDDVIASTSGGLARIRLDHTLPAFSSLTPAQELRAVLDDPLALPDAAGRFLAERAERFRSSAPAALLAAEPTDDRVRRLVPLVLRLGGPDAPAALARVLETSKDVRLRKRITTQLVQAGAPGVPALVDALRDPELSSIATPGLLSIGTPEALEGLRAAQAARLVVRTSWTPAAEPGGSDRDADGIPDPTEILYGLDPDKADSDGDGEGDAADPCPLLAGVGAPIHSAMQVAWLSLLDLHPGTTAALADKLPSCLPGLPGPLVHQRAEWFAERRKKGLLATPLLRLEPKGAFPSASTEGDSVVFTGSFHCGSLCGFGYEITVVHRSGHWFVSKVDHTWVS